jgi:hypothetical protein
VSAVNTSFDVKTNPSSTALREFDVVKPNNGSTQTRQEADTSSANAEVLHVSPSAQQRSLDEIERDFMHCLCAPGGERP